MIVFQAVISISSVVLQNCILNKVCKKALMYGSQQQHRLIDDRDVLYVVEHEMIGGDS